MLVEWLARNQQEAAATPTIRPGLVPARLSRAKAHLRRMPKDEEAPASRPSQSSGLRRTSPPPDLFERVLSRHRRPDRNRRSELAALTVMAVVIGGLLWSVTSDTVPASGGVTGERGTATGAAMPPFDVTTEAVAFEAGTDQIPSSALSVET